MRFSWGVLVAGGLQGIIDTAHPRNLANSVMPPQENESGRTPLDVARHCLHNVIQQEREKVNALCALFRANAFVNSLSNTRMPPKPSRSGVASFARQSGKIFRMCAASIRTRTW